MNWTRMVDLRGRIRDEQAAKGVHVIGWCHAFGFLDTTPPRHTVTGNANGLGAV